MRLIELIRFCFLHANFVLISYLVFCFLCLNFLIFVLFWFLFYLLVLLRQLFTPSVQTLGSFWQDMKIAFRFCDNLRKSADAKDGDVKDIQKSAYYIYLGIYVCVVFVGVLEVFRRVVDALFLASCRLGWFEWIFFMILRRIERTLWLCWRLYD